MEQNDPRTHATIGAAMEVHRQLGHGFAEAVYQEAFELELATRGLPFERQVLVPIYYKDRKLETFFRIDLACFENILVEIKALGRLTGVERAQVLNYLKATRIRVGLLINFGAPSLDYERLVFGPPQSAQSGSSLDLSTPASSPLQSVKSAKSVDLSRLPEGRE